MRNERVGTAPYYALISVYPYRRAPIRAEHEARPDGECNARDDEQRSGRIEPFGGWRKPNRERHDVDATVKHQNESHVQQHCVRNREPPRHGAFGRTNAQTVQTPVEPEHHPTCRNDAPVGTHDGSPCIHDTTARCARSCSPPTIARISATANNSAAYPGRHEQRPAKSEVYTCG